MTVENIVSSVCWPVSKAYRGGMEEEGREKERAGGGARKEDRRGKRNVE